MIKNLAYQNVEECRLGQSFKKEQRREGSLILSSEGLESLNMSKCLIDKKWQKSYFGKNNLVNNIWVVVSS